MKRTVIISMIGFGIFITAGITLIFVSSSKRDAEHIRLVELTGHVENQILKSRILIDDMVLGNEAGQRPALMNCLDSVKLNMNSLHRLITLRYKSNPRVDIETFNEQYNNTYEKLSLIEHQVKQDKLQLDNTNNELFGLFTSFNLNYKQLQSMLPKYLLADTVRYKREIMIIIIINLIMIFMAGFFIIRLINRLIRADRALIRNTIDVEKRERERIAADLHDSLGSLLSGLIIYLQVLEKEAKDDPVLMPKIKHLNSLANLSLQSIEEVINNLNPGLLSRLGLIKSIEKITDKVNKLGKTQFSVNAENFTIKLQESTELLIYRICSELINNALKHSKAQTAEFILYNQKNCVRIIYRDNGVGFDAGIMSFELEKSGLYNIIHRVESLEGKYEINSEPGQGVEVKITFNAEKLT
ncbi:MAG: sensor histidine kinase [Bacteroidales bacterium]